ncbi:glycosyltransferase family 8 protein [Carboxylicivirga mesophila]|uniref:Glycosyltransferase family 8 protein n=1 Tax=Carboxylicivirga mesophila TaxID=1166478 RepID=A0ABS5K6G6_9BACT|nr:glycosyltransferase family 8 protein [Carboxylicivirga mesophila]MBS2209958.1 glycosyltransferase family 8 protein [Carboxylicivirga mesophila]
MASIPIVISFNDSFATPASVCVTSLLANAAPETHYIIYVLYASTRLNADKCKSFYQLANTYQNASVQFIDVDKAFEGAYEVRDVTIESYYRLLIPIIFNHLDKLIYLDVDTIVNTDLSEFYHSDIKNHSIGGIPEFYGSPEFSQKYYINNLNLSPKSYINAGILLFNLRKIRKQLDTYNASITQLAKLKLLYQDQDILNLLFKGDILLLGHTYNYTYSKLKKGLVIAKPAIIHYTLAKPWNCVKPFGDVWWNYYNKSIFYDEEYYINYQLKAFDSIETHIKTGNQLKNIGIYRFILLKRIFTIFFKSFFIKLRLPKDL